MNKFYYARTWPRYYANNAELKLYVNWVKNLTKREIGNPFHPNDKPERFLPPQLRKLYKTDSNEHHMKTLVKLTQWYRMYPSEKTDKSIFEGSLEWNLNYHVEFALRVHQYPETIAVQHAMILVCNKLKQLNN